MVVEPKHRQTGPLHDIEQALEALAVALINRLAQMRKHAGHRCLRAGAAGCHVREIRQVTLRLQLPQLGRGVTRVATQTKVGSSGRLAQNQHHQGRLVWRGNRGHHLSVLADRLQRLTGQRRLSHKQTGDGVHAVKRVDHVAQMLVVARE